VTEPVAAASMPPADLDARYEPYASFDEWRRAAVDLHLVDEAAASASITGPGSW
jgi:hypothetical protein